MKTRKTTLGRPRARPAADSTLTAAEQILDAAAALFVENGFAATSTRMIADRVGIRQASLYYHFPTKEDIFAALLGATLTTSLDTAKLLSDRVDAGELSPASALYALAHADAEELSTRDHNAGYLWLLPEARAPRFLPFWEQRDELEEIYGRLGVASSDATVMSSLSRTALGAMLTQLPELIIHQRRAQPDCPLPSPEEIASTCLRICGVSAEAIEHVIAGTRAEEAPATRVG